VFTIYKESACFSTILTAAKLTKPLKCSCFCLLTLQVRVLVGAFFFLAFDAGFGGVYKSLFTNLVTVILIDFDA
jgi:hypothetical protein